MAQNCFSCILISIFFACGMQLVVFSTCNLCDVLFFFLFIILSFFFFPVFCQKSFSVSPLVQAPSGVHVHFWASPRQCICGFRSSSATPLAFPIPDFLESLGDAG